MECDLTIKCSVEADSWDELGEEISKVVQHMERLKDVIVDPESLLWLDKVV